MILFPNQGQIPAEFQGEKDPYVSIISRATEDYKVLFTVRIRKEITLGTRHDTWASVSMFLFHKDILLSLE